MIIRSVPIDPHSLFYRNGTPRQPMLVTLARASLVLSSKNVAAEALDGLSHYSHCWLIYVFHENTDLPGLWKQPPHKDFKAKVMKLIPHLHFITDLLRSGGTFVLRPYFGVYSG